ncbi:MAG: hypothetical protein LM558_00565 [Thermosphaera sp.]|nr:hypothetical protein [Thermosphaera sp.]
MEKPDVGVEGQALGAAVSPTLGAGGGVSVTAPAKFKIWTWGSCGRSNVFMVYPEKLDLAWVTNRTGTVKTEWFVLDVVNMDSRKNMNRELTFLDVFQPIVIYHFGSYSCSRDFEAVYLITKEGGSIVIKELPIEVETKTETMGRFATLYEIKYVVYNGEKIVLKQREIGKRKLAYIVNIKVVNDRIVVSGDTFEIKEVLKRLGFRWNPSDRTWIAPAKVGVDVVRQELEKIPEVLVKEGE